MGLFNRIFKKQNKPVPQKAPTVNLYKEEWDFYLTRVNEMTGSIMVDLGLFKIAPVKNKPTIIWVSVKMNTPNEEGLSSDLEYDQLIDIEERLTGFVTENHPAVYAGRLTSNGKRDFYFYIGDTFLYDKTISEAMVAFPAYDYDYGLKEDPEWNNYFDFFTRSRDISNASKIAGCLTRWANKATSSPNNAVLTTGSILRRLKTGMFLSAG